MLSSLPRCRYENNQLGEVICQLRFPEILSIGTTVPAELQEAIRAEFPCYSSRQEPLPPKLTGAPGNLAMEQQATTINYQFSTADGVWRVNLTSKFISLACSRYTDWETFAQRLDKPLAAFIRLYQPAFFERVGLRYLNFISRKALELEGQPFSRLLQPCWLGVLAEEDVLEGATTRCSVDTELALRGGCRAKIHAGPGMVKRGNQNDNEVKFIFDQDLYMTGNLPVQLSAGALQTLHAQAWSIFRGAITDTLHDAMDPA